MRPLVPAALVFLAAACASSVPRRSPSGVRLDSDPFPATLPVLPALPLTPVASLPEFELPASLASTAPPDSFAVPWRLEPYRSLQAAEPASGGKDDEALAKKLR